MLVNHEQRWAWGPAVSLSPPPPFFFSFSLADLQKRFQLILFFFFFLLLFPPPLSPQLTVNSAGAHIQDSGSPQKKQIRGNPQGQGICFVF